MAPRPVRQSDVVLYGGSPEILHEEKGHVADLPFEWVAAPSRLETIQRLITDRNVFKKLGLRTIGDGGQW
jgi:hypothetical protein